MVVIIGIFYLFVKNFNIVVILQIIDVNYIKMYDDFYFNLCKILEKARAMQFFVLFNKFDFFREKVGRRKMAKDGTSRCKFVFSRQKVRIQKRMP